MFTRNLLTAAALAVAVAVCQAQTRDNTRNDDKGPYLGVLFAPLSEAQAQQLKQVKREQGVWVTQVLPNSPASKAEIQRDDIILEFDGKKVGDCEAFAKCIIDSKPNAKVKLTILRDGQVKTIEATLEIGPALRLASDKPGNNTNDPKAIPKPGAPPLVSVVATPLDGGKMKVAIELYAQGTGKIREVVECEGKSADIDNQIENDKRLSKSEREAAQVALQRIRAVTDPKPPDKK
jgi:hypothetical protein